MNDIQDTKTGEESEYVGGFPIRQDVTVLEGDDPKRLKLGWVMYEGRPIYLDKKLTRSIPKDGLIEGMIIYMPWRQNGWRTAIVEYNPKENYWIAQMSLDGHLWADLCFCESRNVWTSKGVISLTNSYVHSKINLSQNAKE